MGTRAGLYANDAVLGQNALEDFADMLGVLGGYDVVCYDQHFKAALKKARSDGFDERGLAGAYRASDAYSASTHFIL